MYQAELNHSVGLLQAWDQFRSFSHGAHQVLDFESFRNGWLAGISLMVRQQMENKDGKV